MSTDIMAAVMEDLKLTGIGFWFHVQMIVREIFGIAL
jgi:hypothetical protein